MTAIDQLVRDNIKTLQPYVSSRERFMDYGLTFMDANENPWGSIGMPENIQMLNRYPDPYQRSIKEKLALIKNHPEDGIFLGNGSDEIIDLLIRVFCEPGIDQVITPIPGFGMYKVAAAVNGTGVIEVPLTKTYDLDAEKILQVATDRTKIVFLCYPNNPTGNLLSKSEVQKVLERFEGIVVVDEAYIEFTKDPGFLEYCARYPNLVVLQTFSKAWGLAGIRLGIGYSSKEVIGYLNKIKMPYNINQLTQKQALAALEDIHEIGMVVAKVKNSREFLAKELSSLSYVEKVYPSETNFLLVKMNGANEVFDDLISNQVVVKNRSKIFYTEGCLRITVGTEEENQRLIDVLKAREK